MNKVAVFGGTVILGLSLILAACNNAATTLPVDTGKTQTIACTIKVNSGSTGFSYSPDKCEIKVGQKVTIEASGSHPLYATTAGSTLPTDVGSALTPDTGSVTITFAAAGSFGIRCRNHPGMNGTITVTN
jgi:plastocyanin